jgi:hypothetical protein
MKGQHETTGKNGEGNFALARTYSLCDIGTGVSAAPRRHRIFSQDEIKRWNITLLTSKLDGSESAISA